MPKKGTKCRKTQKICIVCGKTFEGTEAAQSCGATCRTRLVRIKAANKRPEYILIAKSKGQKIPDLSAPKRLKFKKGEKKGIPLPKDFKEVSVIRYVTPASDSYDGKRLDELTADEIGMFPKVEPLTNEQIWATIDELNRELAAAKNEKMPPGMLVRMWALKKDTKVSGIQEKIDFYKSKLKNI